MKALVVTLFALETNTSVSVSNHGIIAGLRRLGYEVTVLMPTIDKNLSYFDDSYKLNEINIVRIKNNNLGSKIISSSVNSSKIKKIMINAMRTVYNRVQILDKTKLIIKEACNLQFEEYFDIVISTSDPKTSHILVKKLIKNGLHYGRWIQHWGDPLSGDISKKNIYPEIFIEKYEKRILKDADKIIYVSPFTLNEQKNKHKDIADKMYFVPLPCDEKGKGQDKKNMNNMKKNKLKVVYLGDYNFSIRNILPLYNACRKADFIDLTIAGNSNLQLENTTNIHIFPRVSQDEVKRLEEETDVIIAIGNKKGTQIPGKIYYEASSEKPILFLADGNISKEIMEYLGQYDRFDCCYNEEKNILEKLTNFRNGNYVGNIKTPEILKPEKIVKEIIS